MCGAGKRVEEIIAREKQSENLLKKRKSDLRTLQESLKDIDDFIKCHPEDEKLVENISGIKEKLFLFQESEKSNKRKKNALKSTNDELVKSEKDLFSQKTALEKVLKCKDDAKLELENAQKNLSTILKDKTLADLRTEIEKLSKKRTFWKSPEISKTEYRNWNRILPDIQNLKPILTICSKTFRRRKSYPLLKSSTLKIFSIK